MENTVNFTRKDQEIIASAIISMCDNSGLSAAKFSRTIDIDKADISNLRNKKWLEKPQLIGSAKWIKFARIAKFTNRQEAKWVVAPTQMYDYVTSQLAICQKYGISRMLVDEAGIGKTTACIDYTERNRNVLYIRCSKYPGKHRFIAALGAVTGVETKNRKYQDILDDAIYAIKLMKSPLLILDEAGDLDNTTERILKEIWNDLEGICGMYKVGSQSLRKKMERGVGLDKIGFAESVSRFGKDYNKKAPDFRKDREAYIDFVMAEADIMLKANGFDSDIRKAIISTHARKDLRAIKEAAVIYRSEIA